MDTERLGATDLDLLIVLEEFRYWDAKRNHVPENELEKISANIASLKMRKPGPFKKEDFQNMSAN